MRRSLFVLTMVIPHDKLSPEAPQNVIEEFVSRDGAETTDVATKVEQVRRQLERGKVVVTFDEEMGTCNIVAADQL